MPKPSHAACARTARRVILIGLVGVAGIPVLGPVSNEGQAARPAAPEGARGLAARPNAGSRPADAEPGTAEETVGPEEWSAVSRFVAASSPNKWAMYEILPSEGSLKRQLRHQLVQRYRVLRRMEQNDPERHELEARAIWIEDEIYGILRRLDASIKAAEDTNTHEADLRVKVDELVQNRDGWKVRRLQRVSRELRSINGPNLERAIQAIDDEIRRLGELGPDARRARVENRVKEFKQKMTGTKLRPHLSRPLPGDARPPADAVPAADPTIEQAAP